MTPTRSLPAPLALGGAVAIGLMTAIQARINGVLGVRLDDGIVAGLVSFSVGLAALVVAIVLAVLFGYQWTQSRFFVGQSSAGNVAIYQGVQQNLGPIVLSHIYEEFSF